MTPEEREPETKTFGINAAASVIADISAGIYRTPAAAIKELISNAFDADANKVLISTNSPHFGTFTCSDDGSGMLPERFEEIMGLIGGSSKRDQGELSPLHHRPLIGRIGIGILSIAQICRRFEVYSSAKGSPTKFRAIVDLDPYMRPEARRIQLGKGLAADSKIKIGNCSMETAPEDPDKHYTRVVMESILPGFRQQLQSKPTKAAGVTPKKFKKGDMRAFLSTVGHDTVSEHGAYAQLVWELAATAPVAYLEEGPIHGESGLNDLRKRATDFKFQVFVDGVEIFKPISLPTRGANQYKLYPKLDCSKKLSDGRTLRVRGYMYWQQGRILPRELQGLLVRVRNVGVGSFDPTFLKYPKHEGWKFSQLCGELYVDDGLDEAINIDRASFRETDEAYLTLQEFIFQRLGKRTDEGEGIFTSIKALAKLAADKKKKNQQKKRDAALATAIFGRRQSRMVEIESSTEAHAKQLAPKSSGVSISGHRLVVDSNLASGVPPKYKNLFMSICGVVEHSLSGKVSAESRRELLAQVARLFQAY